MQTCPSVPCNGRVESSLQLISKSANHYETTGCEGHGCSSLEQMNVTLLQYSISVLQNLQILFVGHEQDVLYRRESFLLLWVIPIGGVAVNINFVAVFLYFSLVEKGVLWGNQNRIEAITPKEAVLSEHRQKIMQLVFTACRAPQIPFLLLINSLLQKPILNNNLQFHNAGFPLLRALVKNIFSTEILSGCYHTQRGCQVKLPV